MTWAVINTSTATLGNDFAAFGSLAFAEGCFADGETYESWGAINTTETANWSNISTSAVTAGYPFNTFANMAFGEGAFADGSVTETWTNINTV